MLFCYVYLQKRISASLLTVALNELILTYDVKLQKTKVKQLLITKKLTRVLPKNNLAYLFFENNFIIGFMLQPKLNQVINPEDTTDRNIALLQSIRNTFKRNTIISPIPSHQQIPIQYQSLLSAYNFRNSDLVLLLDHLYCKQRLSLSDRNLIRRILFTIFPQKMILGCGCKKITEEIKYINIPKDHQVELPNKPMFYLIVIGKVKINTPIYQKQFNAGQYFGDIQLLASATTKQLITTVQAYSNTAIFAISQQYFQRTFKPNYFIPTNQQKLKSLRLIPQLINRTHKINLQLLINSLQNIQIKAGQKIVKKGSNVNYIYFFYQGVISESYWKWVNKYKAIGLQQTILEEQEYNQSIFAVQDSWLFRISKLDFLRYIESQFIITLQRISTQQNLFSSQKLKTQVQSTSKIISINDFMKKQLVKLPIKSKLQKKSFTSTMNAINEFFFIPPTNRNRSMIRRQHRKTLQISQKYSSEKKKTMNTKLFRSRRTCTSPG